jgi:hypothetical protein
MTKRLILTILFFGSPLWATTYYVDNCVVIGSDANNGTSSTTPWLTINKVNTSTFNPGDSILFESTCTWREQLTVPSSGSAGSPITFGMYGAGAAPIISGADLLTSWVSTLPLYYASAVVQPNQVFRDDQRLTLAASRAALATGQWWWDSTNNRVYVYDDPSGHTMEASQRAYGIEVTTSYVTVNGLTVTEANNEGTAVFGGNYNTIENCAVSYSYTNGIVIWSAAPTNNGLVQGCTVSYSGGNGIAPSQYASNWTIQNNTVFGNSALAANNMYTGGIDIGSSSDPPSNITVQYNDVYSNGLGQATNIGFGIHVDVESTGNTIRYNNTHGNNDCNILVEISINNYIYGNVASGSIQGCGIGVRGASGTPASGTLVYNNTIFGNLSSQTWAGGLLLYGDGTAGSFVNNTFKNNISVGNGSGQLNAFGGAQNDGTDGYGNVYTYNDFGSAATNFITWGGSHYSTYATWEAATGNCGTTGCSHSVQGDPQFENAAAAQFWLASGSPAIDAGTTLGSPYNIALVPGSTWPNSVVTGDQNAYGSGWEMGAFLYVPTIAPPSNVHAVAH